VITITRLGDHDPPEWLITITGLRMHLTGNATENWFGITRAGACPSLPLRTRIVIAILAARHIV